MKRFLILSLFCTPFLLSAQGSKLHVQGQKQQAMGNAGTGTILDAASIYYNPGAISFLETNSVSVGGTAVIVNSVFRDTITHQLVESDNAIGTPITFYANYGADSSKSTILRNMEFGIGVYTPYGASTKYPENWVGRFTLESIDLKMISIQPTISYKIIDRIGIGVGFVYNMGSIDIKKDVFVADSTKNFASVDISGKMSGMGVNAGVFFKATDQMTIGFSYKSKIEMKSDGVTAEFSDIPADLKDSVISGPADIMIPNPATFTLGFGFKPYDKLNIALDVNYVQYSVFDSLRVDFEKNTGSQEDQIEPRKFKDTYSVQLGAQYMATDALAARAGLRYAWTPIPDDYVGPEGGDANHMAYNLGLGYNIGTHFTIDASYSFISLKREAISNSNSYSNFFGSYKTYANFAGLSVAYKF